ncbi:MAG: hypothetical protein ACREUS_03190 [Burkholderiales bacterium]
MYGDSQPHRSLLASLRQVLAHSAISVLAVMIAFSLPLGARYVLYDWWPRAEADANLLLATEIALASALVLLFNLAKLAWDGRHKVAMARRAALAYARDGSSGLLARWRERALVARMPAARDAFVLTLTGYDTFADRNCLLRGAIENAYEVRAMLVNPVGDGVRRRVDSLPPDVTLLSFHREIETSIRYLAELRKGGKKVALRFYDHEPFWKLVVLGDHVWVQYCHAGLQVKEQPEYVFARQHRDPRGGLFVPFYMHFLNEWNDSAHPEYDFDTSELVHRDAAGNEVARAPLGMPIDATFLQARA